MKKLLSVLVAITMCVCLCLTAFAADSDVLAGLSSSLGDLDLENINLDSIKDSLGGLGDLSGIKDTLGGLVPGVGGDTAAGDTTAAGDDLLGGLSEFDPTGALSSFVESLDLSQITDLFAGLTDSLGSLGISLPGGSDDGSSEGGFDITSILGGNSGDGAGLATIMDGFGSVLETLGLDSAVIESLGQSDIVNFFANLYMGSVPTPDPEPETEPTTEAPTTTTTAPTTTTTAPTTTNPPMGVNDGAAVMAACATISVAAAALFVCTRKKHA